MNLTDWEQKLSHALNAIPVAQRGKTGSLLSVIPERDSWEQFVNDVRAVWPMRESVFLSKPACLLLLYDGVAFYEFVSGNFWDGFATTVATPEISANRQSEINRQFAHAAGYFGLPIIPHAFVSSSVAHIGIPISMWDGFLQVCEWALWHEGWQTLDDDAWRDALSRRLGGRKRLISFLVDNRKTATDFIREMLDAREFLTSDPQLTIDKLAQASILRREYFDEVPETADFLRESDPESLFANRARLAWNQERSSLSLYLPPAAKDQFPANWQLGCRRQAALNTASELAVDGAAFTPVLRLELQTAGETLRQRIAGIDGWALYDEVKGRFVNRDRDLLPVTQYSLLSRQALAPQLDGWAHDPEDPAIDIPHSLADGTPICITRLYPESRRPRLKVGEGRWITFAQRRGVVLRLFCGTRQTNAGCFALSPDGTRRVEDWPRPFLEVPLSLIHEEEIANEFEVFLNGQKAFGKWVTYEFDPPGVAADRAERAFCYWQWKDPPLPLPPRPPVVHHSLAALDKHLLESSAPSWLGKYTLHIESRRLGRISVGRAAQCNFQMLAPTKTNLWPTSWGDYLVWVLLSQVQEDATWEEVRLARDAVAMWASVNLNSVYYMIRKLEGRGFLTVRGHRYLDFQNRLILTNTPGSECCGTYCGLTTALYEVIRVAAPLRFCIDRAEWGCPPTLRIIWHARDRQAVLAACQQCRIESVRKLW